MNNKVDLTLNNDFRDSDREISTRPRSIFRSRLKDVSVSMRQAYDNIRNSTTTTNVWYSFSSNATTYTTNSIWNNGNYEYDKSCDRCGRDITRLPWQLDEYKLLCKRCASILESSYKRRIPWK